VQTWITMFRHIVRSAPLTTCIILAVAAPAAAAPARKKPKPLWATVNVCDTPHSPNQLGVRAQMWGDDTRERMYMRFTAQYKAGAKWKVVPGRGRSPWLYAGSALFANQQLGYTFSFDAPKPGTSFLMRGLTEFEWRARRKGRIVVVRSASRLTSAGHPTKNAEPAGFSASTCRIATPPNPTP
jgi:hypothetical protein